MTAENINDLFAAAGVPSEFGVPCVDIDGLDVALTESLEAPQQVLTETWGTSLRAMEILARRTGYRLVHMEMAGVNAFFVREDLLELIDVTGIVERSPTYGLRGRNHSLARLYGDAPRTPRTTTAVTGDT